MKRMPSKLTGAFVVLLLCTAAVITASAQTMDELAARGALLASKDPLATELRKREPNSSSRRGFDIGMAVAEGHTLPGPGKQKAHDSLPAAERSGFSTAVAFSVERNSNAGNAAKGAAIARAIPLIAKARTVDKDVFYWLGFDIATGIFGDPALGAQGNTAVGPGSLKIRDSLSAGGQRGFNAAVKMYLGQDITPPPGKLDPNSPFEKIATKENNSAGELIAAILKEPFISNVQVIPDTHNVVISFASTQSTPPLVAIAKDPPKPDPRAPGFHAFDYASGASIYPAAGQNGKYSINFGERNEAFTVGTTYYYLITVFNNKANDTKRPREQVWGQFTTLSQNVRVYWESVHITNDSDPNGAGEISFMLWVNYGNPGAQYFATVENDLPDGRTHNIGRSFVINQAPDKLSLAVNGEDDDDAFADFANEEEPPFDGPSMGDDERNVAKGEFDLSQYPGANVRVPFELRSMPNGGDLGDLRFAVKGYFVITRPTP